MRTVRVTLLVLSTACSGGASTPAGPSASTPAPTTTNARPLAELCEQHYARERTCAEAYLAELVRVRVELDMPPGIAQDDLKLGRDEVIALARRDWEVESQPEARTQICDALDEQVPASRVDALQAEGRECLAKATCDEFATCAVAHEYSFIESGETH